MRVEPIKEEQDGLQVLNFLQTILSESTAQTKMKKA